MTKIYVLLLVTAGLSTIAHAQNANDLTLKKGDKLLGGSVSISGSNGDNSSTFFSLSPSLGVFTKPNRLIGFSLGFSFNNVSYKQRGFGTSVYKQYWNNLGKNFYFIMQGQIGVGYSYMKSGYPTFSSGEQIDKSSNLYGSVSPGFAYRINRKLVIDAFLNNLMYLYYSHSTRKNTYGATPSYETKMNSFGLNTSLSQFNLNSFQFGFRYIL